jgi:hypothetical protein
VELPRVGGSSEVDAEMAAVAVSLLQHCSEFTCPLGTWLAPLGAGVPSYGVTTMLDPAGPIWDWYACSCIVRSATSFGGGGCSLPRDYSAVGPDSSYDFTPVLLAL